MNTNENVLDATAAAVLAGSRFLSEYHASVQTNRERLLEVFRDNSVLLWNGTKITGVAAIYAFLDSLPVCTTRTASVDVQVLRCESLVLPSTLSFPSFFFQHHSHDKPFFFLLFFHALFAWAGQRTGRPRRSRSPTAGA